MKYNKDVVDKKVKKLWSELEPKIVKEICIQLDYDQKLYFRLDDFPHQLGFCHLVWHAQKKILKRDYGIIWNSPAELNKHIIYD